MASQQQQAAPRGAQESSQLSIEEMTRIMDVAATMRRERSIAQRELNVDETRRMLRERLLEAAKVTGDPVSGAEIDAAIEHYFETLHEFEAPEPGMESFLAHLYVMRNKIAITAAVIAGGAALWWSVFGLGFAPRKPGERKAPGW